MLVIGGGITGAGVALDAASRGLRTALVERDDFASGTSSKSSKLVHGGLRYLQQKELRARRREPGRAPAAADNAPHLVRPLPFLIPCSAAGPGCRPVGTRPCGSTTSPAASASASVHQRLSLDEALAHMPTLRPTASPPGLPLLRRPGRRRPAHAGHRPHRRARPRRGRRQPRGGHRAAKDRRAGGGRPVEADGGTRGAGRGGRQRRRRVGRRVLAGRRPASRRIRPAKGIHVTVPGRQAAHRHRRS